ncbi:hypothetical protein BKA70DRAFT_140078 [Coprinopsis sp. MPI-PUGE-AT-0042]|nr:hypothetical protein BKA70DRAFT_140078 [Coprinopsis sp. MPI-PUGE-AT-0042]
MKLTQLEPVGLNDCPRCAHHHQDNEDKINGWIRCRGCKTQFNARISEAPAAWRAEIGRTNALDTLPISAASPSGTQSIFAMFRRLIVDARTLEVTQPAAGNHNIPLRLQKRGYRLCDNCGTPETPALKLRLCGGCMTYLYCSQGCQKAHWSSHKLICQRIAQQASRPSAPISSVNYDILQSLRTFTSAHTSLLSWTGFQALQLKQVPANIRKKALLVELSPRSHAESHCRFLVSAAHIVPRNYIRDPDVVADIQRREERCRQSGGIGILIIILQCGGVSQVMPVEVDPPSKISWDVRKDWHAVLNHFVESGRTDFKPISTSSRGVYYG